LNKECAEEDGTFLLIDEWVKPLTRYYIAGRYPDDSISMQDARQAVTLLKQIRKFITPKLGLRQ
jgi:hypothetical protein